MIYSSAAEQCTGDLGVIAEDKRDDWGVESDLETKVGPPGSSASSLTLITGVSEFSNEFGSWGVALFAVASCHHSFNLDHTHAKSLPQRHNTNSAPSFPPKVCCLCPA